MFHFQSYNSMSWRAGLRLLSALLVLFMIAATQTACQQVSVSVSPEEAATGVIGKIGWVRGKAYGFTGADEKARAYKGDPVMVDQWVETARKSSVAIFFADGTKAYLGESARLLIDDYAYKAGTFRGTADYKFSVGAMRFISGDMVASGVSITTPTADIGFSGSDALIFVTPSGETIVNVFKGSFTVRVRSGESQTTTPDRAPAGTTPAMSGPGPGAPAMNGMPGPGAPAMNGMPAEGARGMNGTGPLVTIGVNENISVSPLGVLSNVAVGSRAPDVSTGVSDPPRSKETWEFSTPEVSDPAPRDWDGDMQVLDPGASPMHAGTHRGSRGGDGGGVKAPGDPGGGGGGGHPGPGHGDHPEPGHNGDGHDGHNGHDGGDHNGHNGGNGGGNGH